MGTKAFDQKYNKGVKKGAMKACIKAHTKKAATKKKTAAYGREEKLRRRNLDHAVAGGARRRFRLRAVTGGRELVEQPIAELRPGEARPQGGLGDAGQLRPEAEALSGHGVLAADRRAEVRRVVRAQRHAGPPRPAARPTDGPRKSG